ncbi:branched-chain amino acid ABC transporter permease [Bordetella tumulicola]|uniref:branched-chain amino acid ABC transporter permease n=1 Tax=Bordetella tumulicola TaxID=1649133 RepID=UPI0039EF8951
MKQYSSLLVVCSVVSAAFLYALTDNYLMDVFVLTCFYGALAVAWNLMAGMTGLMSLGHALFVGIGAYSVAWGYSVHGWSPLMTWPMGVALSVGAAYVIGGLCFRYGLRGYFFAIATLAFSEVAFFVVSATDGLGRSDGIIMPIADNGPAHLQFMEKWPYGLIIGAILMAVMFLCRLLLNSRTGYYWRALRDNEDAAQALGVNARAMKMRAFLISAAISGLCGAFYANYVAFVDPRSVLSIDLTIQLLVFSIIGGMSQLWGPLLGAGILVPFSDFLRGLTAIQGSNVIFYAALLMILALLLPQGVAGWLVERWRRRGARRAEIAQGSDTAQRPLAPVASASRSEQAETAP